MRQHPFPIDSSMTFTGQQITGHGLRSTDVTPTVAGEPGDESRAGCSGRFDEPIRDDDSAEDSCTAPHEPSARSARAVSAGRHRTAKWLSR
ncbi:hypothetical protein [Tomitella cavernea]|uniref:Uncharacterized protein n=1 Tax=Tomitella cavernea TaxID=1387982 RepID=A0ABP9CQS7_9ACTN|nr:hypothetical protein [Tomitella cavernea]